MNIDIDRLLALEQETKTSEADEPEPRTVTYKGEQFVLAEYFDALAYCDVFETLPETDARRIPRLLKVFLGGDQRQYERLVGLGMSRPEFDTFNLAVLTAFGMSQGESSASEPSSESTPGPSRPTLLDSTQEKSA